jgi:hypothetical protein
MPIRPGLFRGVLSLRPLLDVLNRRFEGTSALPVFRRIRYCAALLVALCAFWPVCVPVSLAKTQDSSSAAQRAKSGTKAGGKTPKKSSTTSAAKKSPGKTAVKSHSGSASASHSAAANRRHSSSRLTTSKGKKPRGQQKIDSDRVEAIQEALIREHYLTGAPTGTWNQTSEDAMRHYQADHGWQSKTVPDSRALIKLGLGPSHDHLLNPESAMTTQPDMPRATSLEPASHSADPAAPASPAPAVEPTGSSSPQ